MLISGGRGKALTVDLFDPATDAWSSGGSISLARSEHTATLLADGRLLVAGGLGTEGRTEVFDPVSGTWTSGATMTEPKFDHTATLLSDGRVLIVGGQGPGEAGLSNRTEIYEP